MDYITIGEVLKPQGIRGEIKVRPLTADSSRYKKLRVVYVDNKSYKITSMRFDFNAVYLKLLGVDDRNTAELFRGKEICIDRVNAVSVDDGEYFITDVIGCKVVTENGDILGEITDILQYGAADVICAVNDKTTFRFPFLLKVVKDVLIAEKKFVVYADKFSGVCVYDD